MEKKCKLTALLVRWFYIVTISDQSANCGTNCVSVGLFGLFIQQIIRNQTGVALVQDILHKNVMINSQLISYKHVFSMKTYSYTF